MNAGRDAWNEACGHSWCTYRQPTALTRSCDLRSLQTSGLPGYRARLPKYRATGLFGYPAIGVLGYRATGLLGYRATGLPGYLATGLSVYWATGLPGCWATGLPGQASRPPGYRAIRLPCYRAKQIGDPTCKLRFGLNMGTRTIKKALVLK